MHSADADILDGVGEGFPLGMIGAFVDGWRAGVDPSNADLAEGRAVTTLYSSWLGATCDVCLHTFRPDDPVLLERDADDDVRVRHDTPSLPCARELAPEPAPDTDMAAAFFAGVNEENALEGESRAAHLLPGNQLLVKRLERHRCYVCAHTFRPLESVVQCICRPADPICAHATHRDPGRGLTCLDDWKPDGKFTRCWMNYRSLASDA